MKRFDQAAIRDRLIQRFRINNDWALLLEDSTITNLIDVIAESEAEIARYGEYLFLEKKWKTAANISSITHLTDLIAAKRRRPISATGFVVVTHNDEEGRNRLQNFGKFFFNLDDLSDFDNIQKDVYTTFQRTKALVPWIFDTSYAIPKYTQFFSSTGIPFLATETCTIRTLKDSYNSIKTIPSKNEAFIKSGGWNGIKYLKVPVIQGVQKRVDFGFARNERFESFVIPSSNVENATNHISKQFFRVFVTLPDKETVEEWVEVPRLRLCGPYDKVYETQLLGDNSGVLIKFGDGVSGRMLPEMSLVSCEYLESLGEAGNIDFRYQITKMVLPAGQLLRDPRTNRVDNFLSCTNINAVSGGRNFEDEDEFKKVAPTSYVDYYAVATIDSYEKQIMHNSPLSLLKLKCFPSSQIKTSHIFNEALQDSIIMNELTTLNKTLGITAILASGDKIEDPENSFIMPITKLLSQQKGPNDFFQYIEPNFIKLAIGIITKVSDLSIIEEQVKNDVSLSLLNKYSIFVTDFKKPLYISDLTFTASTHRYINSMNTIIEGLATISYDKKDIILLYENFNDKILTENTIVAIPFKFDSIYGEKVIERGFRNYRHDSPYLLKVDIKFITNETFAKKNRTFFIFDNRRHVHGVISSVQDSKVLPIDLTKESPRITKTIQGVDDRLPPIYFIDENINGYENRQVRVAQYPYINNVTDIVFMQQVKSFNASPFEIRPYEIDTTTGNNKFFNLSTVEIADRVAISGDTDQISGSVCYKRNKNYFKNIDIIFEENYDTPYADNFSKGYVLLPLSYLEFMSELSILDQSEEAYKYEAMSLLLQNNIEIKVYAQPLLTEFEPRNSNDIIFIDESDIKVEKVLH